MTLAIAWNLLNHDDDPSITLPGAVFLDNGGVEAGMRSQTRVCRLMTRGATPVQHTAQKVRSWRTQGCLTQAANEPGARVEGWNAPGRNEDYIDAELIDRHADWFLPLCDELGEDEDVLLYTPFPGLPGRSDSIRRPKARECIRRVKKISWHLYGDLPELKAGLDDVLAVAEEEDAEVYLTEVNFAAGREVNVEVWAKEHLAPFTDYAAQFPRVKMLALFAYEWKWPDSALRTPLTFKGTAVEVELARAAARLVSVNPPPVKQEPPAEPVVSVPENKEPPMTRAELVALARSCAEAEGLDPDVYERLVETESNFNPDAIGPLIEEGPAIGQHAIGINQGMAMYHPDVDLTDPKASLPYFARWLRQLVELHGGIREALCFYNGGGLAVQAYKALHPWKDSRMYLARILDSGKPDLCVQQFGDDFKNRLTAEEQAAGWVSSACGPIALAGMAASLGLERTPEAILRRAAVTTFPHSAVPLWTAEKGMAGPGALTYLAELEGIRLTASDPESILGHLAQGRFTILSTGIHYYGGQRNSRVDDDIFVGETGKARLGGSDWMTVHEIAVLDRDGGGINAVLVGERIVVESPVVDPIQDALSNLHDLTLSAGPHDEARRVSAQAALNTLKEAVLA